MRLAPRALQMANFRLQNLGSDTAYYVEAKWV